MNPRRSIALFTLVVLIAIIGCTKNSGSNKSASDGGFVRIGTGGLTGVYYPTGGAVAKLINRKRKEYGIRASVESTAGSVYNINAVLSGDLEFGIAQSDRQYQAINGMAEWEGKDGSKLRAICSFHPEVVTLVASADSGIKDLKSLKGKKVNIGNPGSGNRGNSLDILTSAGIKLEDIQAESLKPSEAPKMLQDGRIDAFFYTVGHPSGAITEATSGSTKVHFVPVTGMDELLKKFPYYAKAEIPSEVYPMATNKEDTPSIGVKATLVTSADVSDDIVYAVTKELFENLEDLKKAHPAFARLTKEKMLEGISASFHPGAVKYFKEAGLQK